MKKSYIFMLLAACLCFGACSDDKEETMADDPLAEYDYLGETDLQEGQVLKTEFCEGDEKVVVREDVVMNFGTKNHPVLFPVNTSYQVHNEAFRELFIPYTKEMLERAVNIWGTIRGYDMTHEKQRIVAFLDFVRYVMYYKVDAGLLCSLSSNRSAFEEVVKKLDAAATLVQRGNSQINLNDIAYQAYLGQKQNDMPAKRDVVGDVVSIIESVINIVDIWKTFAENNTPTVEAPDNVASFLNSEDIEPSHYKGGRSFQSPEYKLNFWISGINHSQMNYHVEGVYDAKHESIPGSYIPRCTVKCTWASVAGVAYVCKGTTCYSPPVNAGTFEEPIPEQIGQVKVEYGDCCCFRFFSYMNYSIHGSKGYEQISFSTGR